jgi:hypothetical protein
MNRVPRRERRAIDVRSTYVRQAIDACTLVTVTIRENVRHHELRQAKMAEANRSCALLRSVGLPACRKRAQYNDHGSVWFQPGRRVIVVPPT